MRTVGMVIAVAAVFAWGENTSAGLLVQPGPGGGPPDQLADTELLLAFVVRWSNNYAIELAVTPAKRVSYFLYESQIRITGQSFI